MQEKSSATDVAVIWNASPSPPGHQTSQPMHFYYYDSLFFFNFVLFCCSVFVPWSRRNKVASQLYSFVLRKIIKLSFNFHFVTAMSCQWPKTFLMQLPILIISSLVPQSQQHISFFHLSVMVYSWSWEQYFRKRFTCLLFLELLTISYSDLTWLLKLTQSPFPVQQISQYISQFTACGIAAWRSLSVCSRWLLPICTVPVYVREKQSSAFCATRRRPQHVLTL